MINFDTLAGGALKERLNVELEKVLENIADPNTKDTKARKLTINISFKPNKQRDLAEVSIEAKSLLAPAMPSETKIVIDRDLESGKVVAAEFKNQIPGQVEISIPEEKIEENQATNSNKIVDLRNAK